jgi:hypothetical protein
LANTKVEVIPTLKPGQRWMPREGIAAAGVLARSPLAKPAQQKTLEAAASILGKGVRPDDDVGRETGLVVGYVQSGKTLNFTTVVGLARDNGFPVVIVIAGTKSSLLAQSTSRLAADLDVEASGEAWRQLTNPRDSDAQTIRTAIDDWREGDLDEDERATLLITVLKQQHHLQHLTDILGRVGLQGIPVLVIDDEADQAGLNTKVRNGLESTLYSKLRGLRSVLPVHTYLLYTATPQAPLLINIVSALSPSFVEVLEPGEGYTGGKTFFAPNSRYTEAIPTAEVYPVDALPSDPPDSLLRAMRVFFVGLAYSLWKRLAENNPEQVRRSMLIHPSRSRNDHRTIVNWSNRILANWRALASLPNDDPDQAEFLDDMRAAYDDLRRTERGMPSFEEVMKKMPRALRRTQVIEFNTNGRPTTPDIAWKAADGWILVGGQAVDRGFTVDSLTVTYMGRGIGTGNADSIQQRARFFGYKSKYLGICRVYLEPATLQSFQSYVDHEEIMRAELSALASTGGDVREWKRRFALSPALSPCRASVIALGDDYVRGRAGWVQQRGALLTDDIRAANANAVAALISKCEFVPDTSLPSSGPAQSHEVARQVPMGLIVEMLLEYQLLDARDSATLTGLLLQCGEIARGKNPIATVYRMRPNAVGTSRTVDENGMLLDGFLQGRTGDGSTGYRGDQFYRSDETVTVQLHNFRLLEKGTGKELARDASLLAIYTPNSIAVDWLAQVQAGQ